MRAEDDVGILEWPNGGFPPRAVTHRSAAAAGGDTRWRPPTVADGAWLSDLGLDVRPSLGIVEELARHRAAGRRVREQVEAIGLPRHPAHALRYRLVADRATRTWILGQGGSGIAGWHDERDPGSWGGSARVAAAAQRATQLPWLDLRDGDIQALVGDRMAVLPIQRWAISRAVGRMLRPARRHDEVAMLALSSDRRAVISASGLGPELTLALEAIAARVHAHVDHLDDPAATCHTDLEVEIAALCDLGRPDRGLDAHELAELLDSYDDRILPLLTTCEELAEDGDGWDCDLGDLDEHPF